ncbi:MAG: hypothetical protein H7Z75_22460 [Ferruginibacter sp.]|nr:hypothetical protein [Cytophagales bacterium]
MHIKNMVCDRCIKVVKNELANLGLPPERIKLGEVRLREPADEEKIGQLKSALAKHGFELLDDKKAKMIDRIRSIGIRDRQPRNSITPTGNPVKRWSAGARNFAQQNR